MEHEQKLSIMEEHHKHEHPKSVAFHITGLLTLFVDGSVQRHYPVPLLPASQAFANGVATKDVVVHSGTGIWARIFLPHNTQNEPKKKLPLVLYIHGGAYCIGGPDWSPFHGFCHRMTVKTDAIWVSLGYRLAPEHRLPAAYEDALEAFKWLQSQAALQASGAGADPWLHEFADFNRCLLAGESAGAAIALNLALRIAGLDRAPLNIWGLLVVQPGFHTEAKAKAMMDDKGIVPSLHSMYKFALPEGANLDYPPINPLSSGGPSLSLLSVYQHVLIGVAEKDLRYEMTMKFFAILKELCEDVQLIISRDKDHAFHIMDPECEEAINLETKIAEFICRC